jgi:hypothetical protein
MAHIDVTARIVLRRKIAHRLLDAWTPSATSYNAV